MDYYREKLTELERHLRQAASGVGLASLVNYEARDAARTTADELRAIVDGAPRELSVRRLAEALTLSFGQVAGDLRDDPEASRVCQRFAVALGVALGE